MTNIIASKLAHIPAPSIADIATVATAVEVPQSAEQSRQRDRELIVFRDRPELWEATAEHICVSLQQLLEEQDRADIAVTGGTDGNGFALALYNLITSGDAVARDLDWSRVHFWWGDERYVAADDPDRNVLQVQRELLNAMVTDGILPADNIHPMPADLGNGEDGLDAAALAYEQELHAELGNKGHLDIAMFGLGPDGHCASLFPDAPELNAGGWVSGVRNSPKLPPLRITLTVPFIRQSTEVWFITSSGGKADAVARALSGDARQDTPSSLIDGVQATRWFVDKSAMAKL